MGGATYGPTMDAEAYNDAAAAIVVVLIVEETEGEGAKALSMDPTLVACDRL
jgi:hypothetical protein